MIHTPAIILVRPQMGENIGAAARAMGNFGLHDLRLVAPRDGWPNKKAEMLASHAVEIIHKAQVFETVAEAVADRELLYATSARDRDLVKPVATPGEAAQTLRERSDARAGILFGAESTGLHNDELILADSLLNIPTSTAYPSLNLGQAVVVMAYEWQQSALADARITAPPQEGGQKPATKAALSGFFLHLEKELDARGFYSTPEIKPRMVQNVRALFTRAGLTDQEVRTLHGVVSMLAGREMDDI